jgi:hypothetical protein
MAKKKTKKKVSKKKAVKKVSRETPMTGLERIRARMKGK